MSVMSRFFSMSFAILALSCGGSDEATSGALVVVPDTPPTLSVEIGTGTVAFEELTDAQEVDVIRGPQGGFHVWTAVRVRDVTVGEAQINLLSRYDDGRSAGSPSRVAVPLVEGPGGVRTVAGLRNFITDAAEARGKRIVLRVEVVASGERHGEAEKIVTAR